jgi:hypothetical protein
MGRRGGRNLPPALRFPQEDALPPSRPRESERPRRKPSAPAPPKVQALLLAEQAYQDVATRLFTLQRVYNEVFAPRFPATHGPFEVFLQLTDGYGPTPLTLRLVDADESGPPLFEATLPLVFPDPLSVHDVRYRHSAVVFERPGMYRLQLWGCGQCLGECRLLVGRGHETKAAGSP